MDQVDITPALARRIAVNAQLLDGSATLPDGKEGVAQTIEKLGYVQIDTIAVIRRAHHHTLWTRRPGYEPDMLHELQAEDRRVFEYWGHAASILPMSDYRFYIRRMWSYRQPKGKWQQRRLETHGHLMEPVLERIRREGPLASRDFKPPPGTKRGTWWDWKPSKVALELLFSRGELMVTARRGFQRLYDLTERVLPAGVDTSVPDEDELGRFLVRRALSAHGVAPEREIHGHIPACRKEVVAQAVLDLLDAGQVVRVRVGEEERACYALRETMETAGALERAPKRVALLSPFDNAIIQRARTKRLFGFDYALECYQPAAKRKHGYFVLPILWGEELVGRLDPKADRKQQTLIIRNLFFEAGFGDFGAFLAPFVGQLAAFARFNACESVRFEKVAPEGIKTTLEELLKEAVGQERS